MRGNPLLERRSSADGDNEPRARSPLINGEACPAQYGPTPSGPATPSGKNFHNAGGRVNSVFNVGHAFQPAARIYPSTHGREP